MAYSYVLLPGDGTNSTFTFNFPYLDAAHVGVKVNGVTTAFSWLTGSSISITPAPSGIVEIRRVTPKDVPLVDFSDGSTLKEADLDLSNLFNLYCAQEAQDGVDASVSQNAEGVFNGKGRSTTNFADPTDPSGLVTRRYIEDVYTPQLDAKVTEATQQATNAANSASAATTAETNAELAEAAAEAALADFRNRYQDAQSVAPTTRLDGSPLQEGDLYFRNVVPKGIYVFSSGWIAAGSAVEGTINTPAAPVIATAGLASVPVPGGYDPGFIMVFVNGAKWDTPEIDVSSGTDIVFPTPLSGGEEVSWVAFGTFVAASAVAKTELAAPSGAGLVGISTPSGAAQTLQQHLDMLHYGVANIRDPQFAGGAQGTWNGSTGADDTAAVQAAVNSGARFINVPPLPQGYSYQLTSPIVITTPVSFVGAGVEIFRYAQGSRGAGSWFHINHTGIGFNFSDTDGTAARTGSRFEKIGTWRTQPTPGAGWAPTAHDWDIVVSNYDAVLHDVVLFNPTKGVYHDKGNAGRLTIDGLYGQPLTAGIECNETYDVCRLNDIHFWPYWSDHASVRDYTLKNRRDISLKRCDNPLLSNIFTIFGQFPLVLTPSAAGTPSKVHLSNVDFDGFGTCGILFEAGGNSVTLQGANVTMQGQTGYQTTGIQFNANNCIAAFANLSINNVWRQAIEVAGTNNIVTLGGFEARDWNLSNTSLAAITCAANNIVRVPSKPYFNDTFGANYYSGGGTIEAALSEGVISATTDSGGEIMIAHNSRALPKRIFVQCTGGAAGMTAQVRSDSINASTVKVVFMQPSGAVLASTPVTFYWKAEL